MKELVERLNKILSEDSDVLFAYLYGSKLLGKDYPAKDMDIAVYLKEGDIDYYKKKDEELLGELSVRLHTDKVDLRILNVLPNLHQYRVLLEGILFLCRDEQKRVNFETDVMNRYFEMKPFYNEYTQLAIERLKE